MAKRPLVEERLTRAVIGAFYDVYNTLGFGFLEQVYATALQREMAARGLRVAREVSVIVRYKGVALGAQRLDMVVDDKLVVEVKSALKLHPEAWRQLYSYLRATNLEVGLLLHFGLEPKFHRVVSLDSHESIHPDHPANPDHP
jgi:GxxExxY protein